MSDTLLAQMSERKAAVRDYAIVTAAYWGFTLTDGALRMMVLLHFYRLGYSLFTVTTALIIAWLMHKAM